MSITFPDNDKRETRMTELCADINQQIVNSASDQNKIDTTIKQVDSTIQALLRQLEPNVAPQVKTINLYKTVWEVCDILFTALTFTAAYKVLTKVAAGRLLQAVAQRLPAEANVAEAAEQEPLVADAAEEVGIPFTAKLGSAFGGAVLSVGIGFAIDGIEGRIARDKMRGQIHDFIPTRTNTKVSEMQFRTLFEEVNSLLITYQELQQLGYTRDQIDKVISMTIAAFKPKLEAINADAANAELAQIDAARGSWTNEDH